MNPGYNNNFNVDYTCPGFCSKCFAEVAEFKGSQEIFPGVYRPLVDSLKTNFRTHLVDLSNGTKMTVVLCADCYDLKPDDLPKIMENEVKGWQKEVSDFSLSDATKKWVKESEKISIVDVPKMKWDQKVKQDLLDQAEIKESQIGLN